MPLELSLALIQSLLSPNSNGVRVTEVMVCSLGACHQQVAQRPVSGRREQVSAGGNQEADLPCLWSDVSAGE